MDVAGQFQKALLELARRVPVVGQGQWHDPTPCSEWDVHALTNHVVNELRWVPPLLEGRTIEEVGDRFDGDLLGSDPVGAAQEAMREAADAATRPRALERVVHLSFGDASGGEYLAQITSDVAIHTWDLARAVGADERLDPDLVTFVHDYLAPHVDHWRAAGAFGPPTEVADDADAQDKLLAMVGRDPAPGQAVT